MTRRGGGVILRTASQPAFFFRKMMQNTAKILANFEKIVQKIVNCSNCLQFPEIPAKFRENFTEKLRFQLIFGNLLKKYAKITKICENLKILKCKRCESLLILQSLKNAAKCDLARYCSCPYSRKRAFENSSGDELNSSQRSCVRAFDRKQLLVTLHRRCLSNFELL